MTSHMAREIAEIPEAAARFLDRSAKSVDEAAQAIRAIDPGLLITVARGSSDHAASYLKYAVELAAGIPVASVGPSVASIYGRSLKLRNAACVGISQSGQSPDIVEMLRSAGESGAVTLAITNAEDSPLARIADHCLALHAGAERSVAATKTFIISVLAGLTVLAEWTGNAELRQGIRELPRRFHEALTLDWSPLSDRLVRSQSAFVLGRGPAYAIAAEAALKLKETCGLHAEAYSSAEVLHGPAAIVEASFPVLSLAVDDAARTHVLSTAARLAAQGADVFVTGASTDGCTELPAVEGVQPLLAPLVNAVAFYAFVEKLARRRGFDPDVPPHLRKVTETL